MHRNNIYKVCTLYLGKYKILLNRKHCKRFTALFKMSYSARYLGIRSGLDAAILIS